MYGAANFTGTLQRVSIGLAVKPVIPDKISACKKKKKRWEREGGGSGEGMLEVPPASIYSKPNLALSLRHMNTHARTHLALTPYNILYTGPPDGSSIWRQAKAGAHQPNQQTSSSLVRLVTLQVVIQPHASFYVAFLAAPIPRSAISEGIIS